MHPSIRWSVEGALRAEFVFPQDILQAIMGNEQAWKHYQCFSEAYRRITVAYIDAGRARPACSKHACGASSERPRKGKQLGYGGIERYF